MTNFLEILVSHSKNQFIPGNPDIGLRLLQIHGGRKSLYDVGVMWTLGAGCSYEELQVVLATLKEDLGKYRELDDFYHVDELRSLIYYVKTRLKTQEKKILLRATDFNVCHS